MTPLEFERATRAANMWPLEKKHIGGVYVYLSEGVRRPDEHMDVPHYVTTYAVGYDEKLDMAQTIRFPIWHTTEGVLRQTTQEERLKVCMKDATQWIKDNKEVTRY